MNREDKYDGLTDLVYLAHDTAKDKGFWDGVELPLLPFVDQADRPSSKEHQRREISLVAEKLALIHSEVTEALEALRDDTEEQFTSELADVIIRIGDLAGAMDLDLAQSICDKMDKNQLRPKMHGGKRF